MTAADDSPVPSLNDSSGFAPAAPLATPPATDLADLNRNKRHIQCRIAAGDAFGEDIAGLLCNTWSQFHPPAAGYQRRMNALLHEAFSNALLHGCLEVEGFDRQSAQNLLQQEQEIRRRLGQAAYAGRTISVELWARRDSTVMVIEDDGKGYDAQDQQPPNDSELCIRGMQLINKLSDSVRIENNGRRIVITVASQTNC